MGLAPELLSEKQLQQVKDGNETMLATVRMVKEFDKLKLPWAIENPLSSRLWLTPAIQITYVTMQCSFYQASHVSIRQQVENTYGHLVRKYA